MSLGDSLAATLAGTGVTLARVKVNGDSTVYRTADGLLQATVSHQYAASNARRMIRWDQKKYASDPFIPAQNRLVSQSFWTVQMVPTVGFSLTEQKDLAKAASDYMSASTFASYIKFLGGES
jgi:hypothetical protein